MDLEKLAREWSCVPGIPLRWQFPNSLTLLLHRVAAQARREGIEEAAKLMVDLGESGDAERIRALATEDKKVEGR